MSKRARSPSPASEHEDSEVDEVDEVDDMTTRKQSRRNKLREVAAYASDSSEDDFFTAARSARKEDDDMFDGDDDKHEDDAGDASSSDDDIDGVAKKNRKVRFMDISEIEGQEMAEIEDDDEEEVDDDAASEHEEIDPEIGQAGSRLHAPQLEAFNMRDDLEHGQFDVNGTFIRKTDDDDGDDDEFLNVSSREIKAAKKADDARRAREQARDDTTSKPELELYAILLRELQPAESPLEALHRLAPPKHRRNRKAEKPDKTAEAARKASVEAITEAADALFVHDHAAYETERELFARRYQKLLDSNKPTT